MMMVRSVRPLLIQLLLLAIATVANACLSGSSSPGSCCAPALASQMAVCCQSAQAASVSPCCGSSHSSQPLQNAPSAWPAAQPSSGCSSAGCSGGSSGGDGCSGGGCGNSVGGGGGSSQALNGCTGGGCSNSAGGSGGGSSGGCANDGSGSGCSGSNGDGSDAYDASAEYQTSEFAEYPDGTSNNGDGAAKNSAEGNIVQGTVAPDTAIKPAEEGDYEESVEEHVGTPEKSEGDADNEEVKPHEAEKPEEGVASAEGLLAEKPDKNTDNGEVKPHEAEKTDEYIDTVEEEKPEEQIDAKEKSHEIEEHIDIPERKPKTTPKPAEAEQPEEVGKSVATTHQPVEEHTEAAAYTDAPPALPSRPKKSHGSQSEEEIKAHSLEKSFEIEQPEPKNTFETDSSVELEPVADEAACQFITCNFEENGLCLYETSPDERPKFITLSNRFGVQIRTQRSARYMSRKWEPHSGQYHNRVTGVPKAGTGESFGAAYLRPRQRAILTTDNLFFKKTKIRFQAYEATKGIEMRMCCDSLDDCPWRSNIGVRFADMKWLNVNTSCPKGTKRILFVCENSGKFQGACGVDNIRVDGHSCEEIDTQEFFSVASE